MVTFKSLPVATLYPLDSDVSALRVLNRPLAECQQERLAILTADCTWDLAFWADAELLTELKDLPAWEVVTAEGRVLAATKADGGSAGRRRFAPAGVVITYPWDVLAVNEKLVAAMKTSVIAGEVNPRATVEGFITLGEGSRILPGVYIEGNCVIGKDCKIGPNAYLRGNTVIGDRCHVGQAVEIKNSVLGNHVSVGHLSYVGDSVFADDVNFGAGTVIGNLRHDGCNHRSMVDGTLISTGRRKFGAIIGKNVHTGIHTSIYPGRKLGPGVCTRPGEVVQQDITESKNR